MQTHHQFLLLSASPEKEQRFQELKEKFGSFFAFHGSPIGNWHSIMRTGCVLLSRIKSHRAHGQTTSCAQHLATDAAVLTLLRLRNASGSKLQLHGAAYGNGIYLADNVCFDMGSGVLLARSHCSDSECYIVRILSRGCTGL